MNISELLKNLSTRGHEVICFCNETHMWRDVDDVDDYSTIFIRLSSQTNT